VVLKVSGGARIWASPEKGAAYLILAEGQTAWDLSKQSQRGEFLSLCDSGLYVEGVALGPGTVTAAYEYPKGHGLAHDTIQYTFVAATCGSQPTVETRQRLLGIMPDLVGCQWSITGEADSTYNCIAWSVGETDYWYTSCVGRIGTNLVGIDDTFGNQDSVLEWSDLDAFYWAKKHYTPYGTGPADATVIYYAGFHVAFRKDCGCGDGRWLMFESKCGGLERIEHVWDQVVKPYGEAVRFYR
jgi:hypothetical protein